MIEQGIKQELVLCGGSAELIGVVERKSVAARDSRGLGNAKTVDRHGINAVRSFFHFTHDCHALFLSQTSFFPIQIRQHLCAPSYTGESSQYCSRAHVRPALPLPNLSAALIQPPLPSSSLNLTEARSSSIVDGRAPASSSGIAYRPTAT